MKVIPATPADRTQAADCVLAYRDHQNHDWQGRIRKGECDEGRLVQSYARHRVDAQAELAAEVQRLLGLHGKLVLALEFYADRGLDGYGIFATDLGIGKGDIILDAGDLARNTLVAVYAK